jgi:Protein of unknown function (DUF1580)
MIQHEIEQLVTFAEASKLLPGRPSLNALWRWRTHGVRGVKLETILVGGKRYTSREALQRFIERTTAAADGKVLPSRTTRQRKREDNATNEALLEAGLLPA